MNINILERIEATSKRTEKEALLRLADAELCRLIKLVLDQDVTFGVTVGDDEQNVREWAKTPQMNRLSQDDWVAWTFQSLNLLRTRALSGLAASDRAFSVIFQAPTALHAKWASRIINRNLRAGIDKSTFDKVFGQGTVQKFEVQLAETFNPERHELRGVWYAQPKLDGNRAILIDGKAMSRGGKEYVTPFVEQILKVDPDFFKHWVVDGEIMGDLGFDQSSGALRRLDKRGAANFTFWAFDLIDREGWRDRNTLRLRFRLDDLAQAERTLFSQTPGIRVVPTTELHNPSRQEVASLCNLYVKHGFEGAMLKKADAPYVFKRGDNLLKVKQFYDADLYVTGFYEGRGKHKGRLGGIWVSGLINGEVVRSKVGSGFADALRDIIWADQKSWQGAVVQIQYQEHTKDGALRFPVFVMRRKDKEYA